MLTLTVDTFFGGSALTPLSVNKVLFTVTKRYLPLLSTFTITGAFTLTGATVHNVLLFFNSDVHLGCPSYALICKR